MLFCYFGNLSVEKFAICILKSGLVIKFACVTSSFIRAIVSLRQCCSVLELKHQLDKQIFTSASTLGVKTSSDIEDFLGFSGGVVELVVGCVGITLGVVGGGIPGVGSTIG